MADPGRHAVRRDRPPLLARGRHWLRLHGYHVLASLGRLWQHPLAGIMTLGVIAVSLALPASLYVALTNLQSVSHGWHDAGEATLFLEAGTEAGAARELVEELATRTDVAQARLMTPEQAMAEFRRLSGYGEALDALAENPLPFVVLITPAESPVSADSARAFVRELERLPGVDFAQFDVAWLERFNAILALAGRIVWIVAALLVLAVLLVIGNTIRLDIENRREEIEVQKLIGATDRFIRRPLLYSGMWYGLLGGLAAVLVVQGSLWLLAGPVARLAGAYESGFQLNGLGLSGALALSLGGAAAGLAGAWLAAGRHLARIEPT